MYILYIYIYIYIYKLYIHIEYKFEKCPEVSERVQGDSGLSFVQLAGSAVSVAQATAALDARVLA